VRAYRGRLITNNQSGVLATFAAPGQAIRCAAAIRDDAAALGVQIRMGIHAGEVDLAGDDADGPSVRIAHCLAALARPAEILVSRAVKDLVLGTGISFADRGRHELSGVPDRWQLFAVTQSG
jgi:class 3 adenylate cyclase